MGFKNNVFLLVVFTSALLFKEAICSPRKLAGGKAGAGHIHITEKTGIFVGHELQLVDSVCKKTDYSTLCVESVTPALHGPPDPFHLLMAEIDATTLKFKNAIEKVNKLASNPSTTKYTMSAYDICKSQYDSAIDSLNTAKLAINSHDVGTLDSELSAVISDAGTCDDTFAEDPETVSPFTDTDTELSHLGSNCLAIASLIKW